MGKFWWEEKLTNLANRELFTKFSLTNMHGYIESVFGICTDCSLFAKIFLANSFYAFNLPVWFAKIFPCQIFSMYGTVRMYTVRQQILRVTNFDGYSV